MKALKYICLFLFLFGIFNIIPKLHANSYRGFPKTLENNLIVTEKIPTEFIINQTPHFSIRYDKAGGGDEVGDEVQFKVNSDKIIISHFNNGQQGDGNGSILYETHNYTVKALEVGSYDLKIKAFFKNKLVWTKDLTVAVKDKEEPSASIISYSRGNTQPLNVGESDTIDVKITHAPDIETKIDFNSCDGLKIEPLCKSGGNYWESTCLRSYEVLSYKVTALKKGDYTLSPTITANGHSCGSITFPPYTVKDEKINDSKSAFFASNDGPDEKTILDLLPELRKYYKTITRGNSYNSIVNDEGTLRKIIIYPIKFSDPTNNYSLVYDGIFCFYKDDFNTWKFFRK
jgi:hypothetical protein